MSKIIDWKYKKLKDDVYVIWFENIDVIRVNIMVRKYNEKYGYEKLDFGIDNDVSFISLNSYNDKELFELRITTIDSNEPSKDDVEILSEYELTNFIKIMDFINDEDTVIEEVVNTDESFIENIKEKEVFDNVNKPNHYQLNIKGNNIQVIDIIDEVVKDYKPQEAFKIANIIKYVLRASKKNGIEDLKKARKYIDMLVDDDNE